MSEIVEVNFGKRQREVARMMARLLGIKEEFEADLLADPAKYYERAAREIERLRGVIREAKDCLRAPIEGLPYRAEVEASRMPATIMVYLDEWNRLKSMAEVLRRARTP